MSRQRPEEGGCTLVRPLSRRLSLLFIALLCCGVIGSAQQPPPANAPASAATVPLLRHSEAGSLLIRHYPPETYDGGAQNWMVLQDARGVIYVASTNALLEYDGVTWRRIQTPSRTTIRSMAADDTGRIWIGAVGDLGYIEPDDKGETSFVSLADELPSAVRIF